MKILALESSAHTASCAVCDENAVICESSLTTGLTHSQTLMVMLCDMLKNANVELDQIDAAAVSLGPGSFTGIRIGVSALKGIAHAMSLPCVGVSTLLGLARNIEDMNVIACAVMDARRDQVYNAVFDMSRGECKRLSEDRAISIEQLTNELKNSKYDLPIFLVGDGAKLCYDKMKSEIDIKIAPPQLRLQRASSIGFCGIEQMKKGNALKVSDLMPKYLRLSQAERLREEKLRRELK